MILKFYLHFCITCIQNCTGVYYGIDLVLIISRNDTVAKINDAYLVKPTCGFNSANVALIVRRFSVSDEKNLDGLTMQLKMWTLL